MRTIGIMLLFAPTLLFIQEQMGGKISGVRFTWLLIVGRVGLVCLALSQRISWPRVILAFTVGLIILVAQLYGIAALVMNQSGG